MSRSNKRNRQRRRQAHPGGGPNPSPPWKPLKMPLSDEDAETLLHPQLGLRAKEHWRKFLPYRYASLVAQKRLHLSLLEAQRWHVEMMHQMLDAGWTQYQAEEFVNPTYLFLQSEEAAAEQLAENEKQDDVEAILERIRAFKNHEVPIQQSDREMMLSLGLIGRKT